MTEWHHDDRRHRFTFSDKIIHDRVRHARLRPAAFVIVGPVQEVKDGIALAARAVVGWRVDDNTASVLFS